MVVKRYLKLLAKNIYTKHIMALSSRLQGIGTIQYNICLSRLCMA